MEWALYFPVKTYHHRKITKEDQKLVIKSENLFIESKNRHSNEIQCKMCYPTLKRIIKRDKRVLNMNYREMLTFKKNLLFDAKTCYSTAKNSYPMRKRFYIQRENVFKSNGKMWYLTQKHVIWHENVLSNAKNVLFDGKKCYPTQKT